MTTAATTVAMMPALTLPPSGIKKALIRAMFAGLVPIVTSSPGVGKTDIANEIAHEYRLKLVDFRLSQADITDLNGLPFRGENGRASFLPFDIFPLEGDELPDHPDGGKYEGWLIFIDEITSAPKQMQAAAYKLLLERMVGTHKIHNRVKMMAAGNLASDKAVVHTMSTALQSRLVHLELRVDHKEWMTWAQKHNVDGRILGFLDFKKEYLHRFNPDHEDKTFACPRTWWFTHLLINGQKVDRDDTALLAGTISVGIATEFVQFLAIYDQLPKIQDLIDDPLGTNIPDDVSVKYAMITMLAGEINSTNSRPIVDYISRYPIEMRVTFLRMVRSSNSKMMKDKAVEDLFTDLGRYA